MKESRLPLRKIEDIRSTGAAWISETELETLLDIAEAAGDYAASTGEHYWRCEYRTAEKGWNKGDPPVIVCQCGLDRLIESLQKVGGW